MQIGEPTGGPSFPALGFVSDFQAVGAPLCAVFAGWERRMSRIPGFDLVSLLCGAGILNVMEWGLTHRHYTNRKFYRGELRTSPPPTLRTSRRVGAPSSWVRQRRSRA